MPRTLVAQALEQAKQYEPIVCAPALLQISRVENTFDRAAALRTFQEGVNSVPPPARPGHARVMGYLVLEIAAAIVPERVNEFDSPRPRHHIPQHLCRIMLEHGHLDQAIAYVLAKEDPEEFPFLSVSSLIRQSHDEAKQRALLRHAADQWRRLTRDNPRSRGQGHWFVHGFENHWSLLPGEEALALTREIVTNALAEPDGATRAEFGRADAKVTMSSSRELTLFRMLAPLRRLDPALAESLIAGHSQLAAAAQRYPNGMESVHEELQSEARRQGVRGNRGWIMGGSSISDISHARALHQATMDGDFSVALENALEQYREDINPANPNLAPRAFWPSTSAYRTILYNSGKREGRAALTYLDRIPDPAIQLFVRIDLAAALAGLPELRSLISEHRPPRTASV